MDERICLGINVQTGETLIGDPTEVSEVRSIRRNVGQARWQKTFRRRCVELLGIWTQREKTISTEEM